MSNFGYNHLREEVGSLATAQAASDPETSINVSADAPFDSIQLNSNEDTLVEVPGSTTSQNNRANSENVRYTALRPTSVRELVEVDVDRDTEGADSSILVSLASNNKRKAIPKVYVVICSLLTAGVTLVAFTLIYVFIILPISNENHYPDADKEFTDSVQPVADAILVRTSCGTVQGSKEQAAYVFRGIPYAVPPTGSLRWKLPVAMDGDNSVSCRQIFNATYFGNKCLQPKFENHSLVEGSENCLYLNVWTPSLNPSSRLPVMVWFHSGDLVYGSGHMTGMSPTPQVAVATNAVYVSFNYRLGVFGFLAVDELRADPGGATGNYGFMDQQIVLKWVQKNIRRFGGDDNKVTIFGHGSGATSVLAMLMSPGSRGLFHKAWLTSPVAVVNKTVEEACRDNRQFMKTSGCDSAQCLRQLPAETVSRLSPWSVQPHWTLHQLFSTPMDSQIRNDLPIFDGDVLRLSSSVAKYDGHTVPVVFGSTYFDMSGLDRESAVINMTWDQFNKLLDQYAKILGSDAVSRVKSLYSDKHQQEPSQPTKLLSAAGVQFAHLLGDIKNVCPVKVLTDAFVETYSNSSSVYMYVADMFPLSDIQLSNREKSTFIGWDVVSFFGSFQDLELDVGQGEINFQNIIRQEIMSFVKSDQPDASRWKTADVNVGIIGRDVTVTPVASDDFTECNLWKQYGFFNYTWKRVL